MNTTAHAGGRAVVLGGSIAGLLVAHVLADAFDEVVVVDRDELPDAAVPRRGVPQDRHIHALLARGQQVLEELFPGFTAGLVAAGAPTGDLLADVRTCIGGHLFARRTSGLTAVSASRPLLEAEIRKRVRERPGVRLVARCDALGLAVTPDGRRVCGARILRATDGSAGQVLDADLVVDATGRGSRMPRWLADLGVEPPEAEQVRIGVRYATRSFRLARGRLEGDLAVLHGPTPARPRGGALAAVEGDRHVLTLFGMLDDAPPLDPDGFIAFAGTLGSPEIARAVRDAEPLSDPVAHHFPYAVRRRYERAGLPDGLVVVGDASCSFNPVYGQGITVAALQALVVRRAVCSGWSGRTRRLQRGISAAAHPAWNLATGADLAFPEVGGRRTAAMRVAGRFVARVQAGAAGDPAVAAAFVRVTGLVEPPTALLRPGVVVRLAAGWRRGTSAVRTGPVAVGGTRAGSS
ncbi:FAD-dependent oxidoreductase [Pseudonocardia hydrocarbonoxydans]|uniref:FAD-binding monooxygenase n=1 Tax=Pseudonocardia hydrocarbonoxydans TaxID=76726 RepID=A0A4Y3WUE1_9PSEU|nr:FAD-binding monooxygenase [Pseudonocardia hydrocarbonoxydans]GEC21369.1 FAD-binding monooxygenase [Pseudonocardia hydrocarbonoxydans]